MRCYRIDEFFYRFANGNQKSQNKTNYIKTRKLIYPSIQIVPSWAKMTQLKSPKRLSIGQKLKS